MLFIQYRYVAHVNRVGKRLIRGAFRKLKTNKSSYLYQIIRVLFRNFIGCLFSLSFSIVVSLIVDHRGEVSYRDCSLLQRSLWSRSSGSFGYYLKIFIIITRNVSSSMKSSLAQQRKICVNILTRTCTVPVYQLDILVYKLGTFGSH